MINPWQIIVDEIEEGLFITDKNGNFTNVNKSGAEIFGYTIKEILELSVFDIHSKVNRDKINKFFQILKEGNKISKELVMQKKNGEPIHVQIYAHEISHQKFIGIIRDISDKKEVEKKLSENLSMLKTIIDVMPGTLNVVDKEYNIIAGNNQDYRLKLTDYNDISYVIGKKCYEVFMKRTTPCPWCKVTEALETGKTIVDITTPGDMREVKTGRALQVLTSPIYNENGEIKGAVEYGVDITELRNAKLEAEKASIAKSQFLANMSHEIRTPMNGILGFLQLLQETELNEEQKKFISNIKVSTDNLLTIINEILDISKIESGKMEFEEVNFNMHSLIESIVVSFVKIAKDKGIELNMLIHPSVPQFVISDSIKIRQVITNLLNNAVKFTNEGEIFLEVSLKEKKQGIFIIEINVKDTGIGMNEQEINNIFKPFTQADSSVTRKYGGTGLGLCICEKIVKLMKGEILVTSKEGKGSNFKVTIPLKKSKNKELDLSDYSILKGKNVLIVDDNIINRDIARIYLQEKGCMVSEASNGAEAISEVLSRSIRGKYDLILIDYQMPDMSGFDLASALKAISSTKCIPLILLSSVIDSENLNTAKEHGFDGYISKPYKRRELINCILKIMLKTNFDDNKNIVIKNDIKEKNNGMEERDKIINKSLKILLVEDNEINKMVFNELLEKIGYTYDVAVNGQEAVKKCLNKEYDIIFMDCQMPVMNGFEATKEIRKIEGNRKHTIIIAMTAYAMESDKQKCIEVGMDDYISKPIIIEDVMSLINKYSN